MVILGCSFDTPEENKAFADKQGYTFSLLSDTSRAVGMAYGACDSPKAKYPQRITYVIGPDGKIEQAIDTKDPAGQAEELLKTV